MELLLRSNRKTVGLTPGRFFHFVAMNLATLATIARLASMSRSDLVRAFHALDALGWEPTDPRYLELEAALIAARIRIDKRERKRH